MHRLAKLCIALHLQKLYERLKDYEPAVDYQYRLKQISKVVDKEQDGPPPDSIGTRGIWTSLLAQKEKRDSLALARVLTDQESAQHVQSPKGLMLHGEVGTGKSMLIDLFAECLPNRKKRRWHFNTFMLEAIARLEHLRKQQSSSRSVTDGSQPEHSLLWLARDLIQTSPILFLDEFQLPDRAASKIMTSVMTSFFQLGGVLIATSNRMPDELAKAAGIEFTPPPNKPQPLGAFLGLSQPSKRSDRMFAGGSHGEFADFLELLKSRCDIWEIEGKRDYRRSEAELATSQLTERADDDSANTQQYAVGQANDASGRDMNETEPSSSTLPSKYLVRPASTNIEAMRTFIDSFAAQQQAAVFLPAPSTTESIPWTPAKLQVYGRQLIVPRHFNGVSCWTFDELCGSRLGSADYITLASNFHTIILTDVPVLTTLQKNEARRLITLLDALYESRCKLLVSAEAGPDDLFFPEQRQAASASDEFGKQESTNGEDAVYAETFAEAYQDATAPFRPNISSYDGGPDYTHARLQGMLAPDALEDDPPNKVKRGTLAWARGSTFLEGNHEHFDMQQHGPDFAKTRSFIGEDEKFAYKRARSRLWEMCGTKWWARNEEGWWRPVPLEIRRWENPFGVGQTSTSPASSDSTQPNNASSETLKGPEEGMGESRPVDEANDKLLYEHKANPLSTSPFRTHNEPPPNISWTHVWGTMKWGKKAGAWGQGVEGLKERKKPDGGNDKD